METKSDSTTGLIKGVYERWHLVLRGELEIDEILHPNCIFWSPVLFHPQRGRELTKMYLSAASLVFPGDEAHEDKKAGNEDSALTSFRYTKRVLDGYHAVLEFETSIDGLLVNGVDIITCDDSGLIVEFKVMIRPRQALEKVREQMMSMIDSLEDMP
ncbi:MAG: hypothetical protein CL470_05050 [Acidimicrobiaceae bacterium]|nr:hypothetical protein [Acidimicrobiaceae bacterium]|tara:strand:- start:220 stop:690 length:471 start_codon:yes stop_codon:yes gene_type:complete